MACHYKPYHLHYQQKVLEAGSNRNRSALLIVNVQKAFLPGGSMSILNERHDAKSQSIRMINNINSLIDSEKFDLHIYVQDSHPDSHISFASAKPGAKPFQIIETEIEIDGAKVKQQQLLCPDHCRIDGRDRAPVSLSESTTETGYGIQLASELRVPGSFRKTDQNSELEAKSFVMKVGEQKDVDSFSAFKNSSGSETGLAQSLISKGVSDIYVVGVARDFAAWWTALDATSYVDSDGKSIFKVHFVWDATLPLPGKEELPEYEYDGNTKSPHHDRLRAAISSGEYHVSDVVRHLENPDPSGNRWVETYLIPYGVQVEKTSDILDIPINATVDMMRDIQRRRNQNRESVKTTGAVETIEKDSTNFMNRFDPSELDFIRIQRIQESANDSANYSTLPDLSIIRTDTDVENRY